MTRKIDPRLVTLPVEGIDGLTEAFIRIRTNFPVGRLLDLNSNNLSTLAPFLADTIVSWNGFDMELSEDGIRQLTLDEIRAIVGLINEAVANPPKPSNDSS